MIAQWLLDGFGIAVRIIAAAATLFAVLGIISGIIVWIDKRGRG